MLKSCGERGVGVASLAITVDEEKAKRARVPPVWRVANGRCAPRPLCRGYGYCERVCLGGESYGDRGCRRRRGIPGRRGVRTTARAIRCRTESARRTQPTQLARGSHTQAWGRRHIPWDARGSGATAPGGTFAAARGGGPGIGRRAGRRPLQPPLRREGRPPGSGRRGIAAFLSADDPLGRSWSAWCPGFRRRGVLDRGPEQRLQLHGRHRRFYGWRRARQRALPRSARGTGGWFPARAYRGHCWVPDLEHKPCIHLYRGFGSLPPRLQPGRGSLLRPRALWAGVDAFGLPGLRRCLYTLPLRHRIYAGSAVAKRGWEEHLPGAQGAHLPADHPDHRDAQAYEQSLLWGERHRRFRRAADLQGRPPFVRGYSARTGVLRPACGTTEADELMAGSSHRSYNVGLCGF